MMYSIRCEKFILEHFSFHFDTFLLLLFVVDSINHFTRSSDDTFSSVVELDVSQKSAFSYLNILVWITKRSPTKSFMHICLDHRRPHASGPNVAWKGSPLLSYMSQYRVFDFEAIIQSDVVQSYINAECLRIFLQSMELCVLCLQSSGPTCSS